MQADAPPHVLEDEIGLRLIDPPDDWHHRGDMHLEATKGFRASIVARARFIEELVAEQADDGVSQYVILGAGLDTFAQRRPELAARLHVFEVDEPGPASLERHDVSSKLGYGVPDWPARSFPSTLNPIARGSINSRTFGFDVTQPTIVSSTGVTMYLSEEADERALRQLAVAHVRVINDRHLHVLVAHRNCSTKPIALALQAPTKGASASGNAVHELLHAAER